MFKIKHIFQQGVSCLPAPGDTYHLNDCMVIADFHYNISKQYAAIDRYWAGEKNSSTLLEHLQCLGRQRSELIKKIYEPGFLCTRIPMCEGAKSCV